MTAFAVSDIPVSVNTLEKLYTWVGFALQKINPSQTAIEGPGSEVPVVEYDVRYIRTESKTRIILRSSLEVQNGYLVLGGKIWQYVEELSQNALPDNFRDAA